MSDLPPPPDPGSATPPPPPTEGAISYPPPLPATAHWSSRLPHGNEMLGVIYGLVAAVVSGVVWYLVVSTTNRQFLFLAIAMGFIVGNAVAVGSGRSRVVNAIIAVVIALAGMLVSYYFIDRHILVEELGSDARVPLWHSFSFARELVKAGFDADGSQYVFTLIAVALAGIVGHIRTRTI